MARSWASRRVGRKGERRVEERGGRMVLVGIVEVMGGETESSTGLSLRRVDILSSCWWYRGG